MYLKKCVFTPKKKPIRRNTNQDMIKSSKQFFATIQPMMNLIQIYKCHRFNEIFHTDLSV